MLNVVVAKGGWEMEALDVCYFVQRIGVRLALNKIADMERRIKL